MKPIFFAILIGLNLMIGLDMTRAQADEKPVPQAPYLAPVPDYGHWRVTFKYDPSKPAPGASGATAATPPAAPTAAAVSPAPATPAAPAAPSTPDGSPTAIETIKTGDLRGVTLTFADGKSQQFTCQGDWVLRSTPKGPQLGIATPTAHPYIYYTTGFILLDGATINMSTFKEAAKHNGVMAFHYKSGDVDVWIDPDSMLPLAAKQNGVEGSYEFLTPPPRPFDIPKDQESLLQKEMEAYKSTKSMR
jgi:hypothetical protein